jgi:hypothetical protein
VVDPRHSDTLADLAAAVDGTASRRGVIKRLAALGLVAAGGLALAPLAEAKPKKGRGHGHGQGQGQDENEADKDRDPGPEPQPAAVSGRGRGVRAEAVIIGSPTISNPRISIVSKGAGAQTVTVTGTINFSTFDRNQMKQGLLYGVTCQVWERDSGRGDGLFTDNDDLCFNFANADAFVRNVYPASRLNPAASAPIGFRRVVGTSTLDHDTVSEDEVYGLLIVWANPGDGWHRGREVETNQINRRF